MNTINNAQSDIKVNGTTRDDYIINSGENVTIQAGKGNDTLVGSDEAESFWFSYASGADVITNFGVNDTLKCTSGSIASVRTVGDDVIVSLKKSSTVGTVTLQGAAQYDFRKSGAYLTAINRIENKKNKIKVTGTTGDDHIINYGSNVTIQAGKGNDTITGSDYAEQFWFSYASGNDVITNFGLNDTIRCTSGAFSSIETIDNDIVISMEKGSTVGTVRLKDAATNYTLTQNGSYITAQVDTLSSEQLPAEEYWFLDNDNSSDELDGLIEDKATDNLIGQLTPNDPSELLMNNSARIGQELDALTGVRRKLKK